ncbi:MAG: MFS transporter [Pseudonocardia sp.]|nr:MFS transporter [Pseudonocardia sp.]
MTRPIATPAIMSRGAAAMTIGAAIATLLLAVLDTNIVTTAAVPIARDLQPDGGTTQVPWLVAGYILAATVVQPLYGKLADIIGAKQVYLASVGIFLAGSALCAAATSMPELIAFRALQGLGGGGLLSVTMVVIGHLRAEDPDSDAGASGNLAAGIVVGLGLVCAPLLGGWLVSSLGWQWIFLVNLPLGAVSWLVMARFLRLSHERSDERIDVPSALLIGAAAALLLLGCQWGGQRYSWLSAPELALGAGVLVLTLTFAARQRHSLAPFFPPRLLRVPVLRIVSFLQLATGLGMAAGTLYIVLELQVVHGASPVQTGLALIPEAIGLAAGALIGGILLKRRRPLRGSVVIGTALTALALAGMATMGAHSPSWELSTLLVLIGSGVGLTIGNEVIIVQATVERRDLGMATTGVRFVESLGTSIGAAALGTVFVTLVGAHADDPSTVAHAISVCFAIGAALLLVATGVAVRLPAEATGHAPPARSAVSA